MMTNKPITKINHYELTSYVVGIVALFIAVFFFVEEDKTWRNYALIASGWIASVMFSLLLRRVSKISEENHISVGELNGEISILNDRIRILREELTRSNDVAHVLSNLVKPQTATPRAAVAATIEVQNPEW